MSTVTRLPLSAYGALAMLLSACAPPDMAPVGASILTRSDKIEGGVERGSATETMATGSGVLRAGQSASSSLGSEDGVLGDDTYFEVWSYEGDGGEVVRVTMHSDQLDAYVALMAKDWSGDLITIADNDDADMPDEEDPAPSLDAELVAELPSDGTYYIIANTAVAQQCGSYELEIRSEGRLEIATNGAPDGRYALLAIAGNYPGGSSDLAAGDEDLRQMYSVMTDDLGFRDEDILVLQDALANRNSIIRGFREHLAQAGPDGVAVFYYSGHGTQIDENVVLDDTLDYEGDGVDDALYLADATVLLDDELALLIDELEALNVLVILDSCNSGTGTMLAGGAYVKEVKVEELGGLLRMPKRPLADGVDKNEGAGLGGAFVEPRSHVLIASSREIESSYCVPEGYYLDPSVSLFTYNLAQAFHTSSLDASFENILRQTKGEMEEYLEELGEEQVPQLRGRRSGDSLASYLRVD